MSIDTSNEKSETNLYAYEYDGKLINKKTYRNNSIAEINDNSNGLFNEFITKNIDDRTFRKFVDKAEENGFTIYRMIKL